MAGKSQACSPDDFAQVKPKGTHGMSPWQPLDIPYEIRARVQIKV
jgi:hypothetical protein